MSNHPNKLTDLYRQGRDGDWLEQKRQNHRKWRRRSIAVGSGVTILALTGMFVIYDMPRETGLTDALGLTCGEYVTPTDPAEAEQIFTAVDLEAEGPTEIADALGAEPTVSAPRIDRGDYSVTTAGEWIVLAHHEELWYGTDRVSVLDPETTEVVWTADIEHPRWDGIDERPRVLSGVGASGDRLILQTPTYRGDTDLVVADLTGAEAEGCIRLDGASADENLVTPYPRDLPLVSDVTAGIDGDGHFLQVHGWDIDAGVEANDQLVVSRVDLNQAEILWQSDYQLPALRSVQVSAASVGQTMVVSPMGNRVGPDHFTNTWADAAPAFRAGQARLDETMLRGYNLQDGAEVLTVDLSQQTVALLDTVHHGPDDESFVIAEIGESEGSNAPGVEVDIVVLDSQGEEIWRAAGMPTGWPSAAKCSSVAAGLC